MTHCKSDLGDGDPDVHLVPPGLFQTEGKLGMGWDGSFLDEVRQVRLKRYGLLLWPTHPIDN